MIVVNVLIIFLIISAHYEEILCQDTCESHFTCRECLRDSHICVWCTTANMTQPRCVASKEAISTWCKKLDVQNTTSAVKIVKDLNFTDATGKYIQVKPQLLDIKLRPGDTVEFEYYFKPADDYPLDLYFLMDFSNSMNVTITTTAQQDISKGLRDLTNNIYLGLGSFIDKKMVPYTLTNTNLTYSFRNHLKLTPDGKVFSEVVSNSKLGENFDSSEGGFDALAQAILCKDEIGWRKDSRKIILFCTDQSYHTAGDGKWAGIVTPYDGRCHMKNNQYTEELKMDYPSVSQIRKLASDEKITIYFVVIGDEDQGYETLHKEALSDSVFNLFTSGSQTLVTKIHNMYQKLSQSLSMELKIKDGDLNHIEVKLDPDCANNRGSANYQCKLKNKDTKVFKAKITLRDYYSVNNTTIAIVPKNLQEMLMINIQIINDCECEHKHEDNSEFCSKRGIHQCGICECEPGRLGSNCQCTVDKEHVDDTNSSCIANGTELVCSGGRGLCWCGRCECHPGYEGKYCQFSKDDCPGRVRGGPCSLHGDCKQGICICHTGWTGEKCDCHQSTDTCQHPDHEVTNNSLCSGLGDCICGKCQCEPMAKWDKRKQNSIFCHFEPCPECHGNQCQILEDCANCVHGNGNTSSACKEKCHHGVISSVANKIDNHTEPWMFCPNLRTDVGCVSSFMYKYLDEYGIELVVQSESDCAESYYLFGGTTLGVVLLIGLLTLIGWKLLTRYRDRRDYEQFAKSHAAAEWNAGANPIYQSPTTTFHNPAFGNM